MRGWEGGEGECVLISTWLFNSPSRKVHLAKVLSASWWSSSIFCDLYLLTNPDQVLCSDIFQGQYTQVEMWVGANKVDDEFNQILCPLPGARKQGTFTFYFLLHILLTGWFGHCSVL